jgi:Zn-dependent protease
MPEFLQNIGMEVPFTLLLLALLGVRAKVRPVASVWIKAPVAQVFHLIDLYDGRVQNWGRTIVRADVIDQALNRFRMTYSTTLSTGVVKTSSAQFHIAARTENANLELHRDGLEGKSLNNELLKTIYHVSPENGGTRLTLTYHWGPRALIAQLLARADLWGGAYRLKGLAETGKPNERPHTLISCLVALATGIFTLVTFAFTLGIVYAVLLVAALLIHEFGHLLAFRLTGQPWGRLIFLPFLGALAVPRLSYESQGQAVFSALMGPGFSTVLGVLCALPLFYGHPVDPLFLGLGIVIAGLNLFNLLPVEPLDGGVALRSVLARVIGQHAHWGLMLVGAIITGLGIFLGQIILVIFGSIAILANLRTRTIDAGLTPLSSLQLTITAFSYVAIFAAHIALLGQFVAALHILQI